jgi:hypothetical protein
LQVRFRGNADHDRSGGLGTDGSTVPVIFRSGAFVHQTIGTVGGGRTTITAPPQHSDRRPSRGYVGSTF